MKIDLKDHPGYLAEHDKLQGLYQRRDQLHRDEQHLRSALKRPGSTHDDATALLSGQYVATATVSRTELEQNLREQQVVAEAIGMQKRRLDVERGRASVVIRGRLQPAYKSVVAKMNDVLGALRELCVQEHEIRESMGRAGVIWTDDFCNPLNDFGLPEVDGQRGDGISRWQERARNAGML